MRCDAFDGLTTPPLCPSGTAPEEAEFYLQPAPSTNFHNPKSSELLPKKGVQQSDSGFTRVAAASKLCNPSNCNSKSPAVRASLGEGFSWSGWVPRPRTAVWTSEDQAPCGYFFGLLLSGKIDAAAQHESSAVPRRPCVSAASWVVSVPNGVLPCSVLN